MQPTNSQQALRELQTYQGGRKSSRDVLSEAETRLGVPTQQQRLTGLRSALGNTENLIRSVEPSVAGRTGGSYVTEAQRNRLVGIERAPLDEAFREQSRELEGSRAELGDLNQRALTEAQLRISEDDRRENELQKLYDTLYGREQAEITQQEQTRQFNAQMEAERRKIAASTPNVDYLSKYFGGSSQPVQSRPPLDSFFNTNQVPLPVTVSRGSTIPLSVARPQRQPALSVAASRPQPRLAVR